VKDILVEEKSRAQQLRSPRQVIGETELAHPDRPLRVELQGDLTGVWDRERLYQLLDNLVGNAVQRGEARSWIGLRIEGGPAEVVIEIANFSSPSRLSVRMAARSQPPLRSAMGRPSGFACPEAPSDPLPGEGNV